MGPESHRVAIQEGLKDHAEKIKDEAEEAEKDDREDEPKLSYVATELWREATSKFPSPFDEGLKERVKQILIEEKIIHVSEDNRNASGALAIMNPEYVTGEIAYELIREKEYEALNQLKNKLEKVDYEILKEDIEDGDRGSFRAIHWSGAQTGALHDAMKIIEDKIKL